MPMQKADYPPDWPAISRRVREDAGQKCEWCGVPNGAIIVRDGDAWHEVTGTGEAELLEGTRTVKIVLTVHHPNYDKGSPDAELVALCQKCHLNADLSHHMAKAAETRRRKRRERGQAEMPLGVF